MPKNDNYQDMAEENKQHEEIEKELFEGFLFDTDLSFLLS